MDLTDRVSHRLKLRDLRLLQAVVQWGSMARAATHLNLTQPAVSKAIAELEHMLGVRLLDRSRQGVEPTPYGHALLKRGTAIFDEVRQSVKDIEFLIDPTAGEVRVGSPAPVMAGLLPTIIERFSRQFPRVVVYVTQANIGTLQFRELRERSIDLLLGRIPSPLPKDLEAEILCDEQLNVVAGAQSRWARRRTVALRDLINEPWTLPPFDSFIGSLVVEAFHASGLDVPRPTVVSLPVDTHCALIASGRFVGVLPGSLLRLSGKRLSLKALPIELPIEPRPLGVITLRNRTLNPVASLFIDSARTLTRPSAKGK